MSGRNSDQQQQTAERLLQGAYDLKSAQDNIDYYREFAPVYDRQFANALGYTYPQAVASDFIAHANSNTTPILDVGCGTGLVAEALGSIGPIDGVDISADMIAVAQQKQVYRHLFQQDLTLGTGPVASDYAAVLSAGTFTHGHLGPEVVELLLTLGSERCLYCLGINAVHYENAGFPKLFTNLKRTGAIVEFKRNYHPIFSGGGTDHAQDKAIVVVFRKP